MEPRRPPPPSGFDSDFDLARRAVEAGLLTEAQVESALLTQEKDPSRRLADLLPISAEALQDLRPPTEKALPAEVALAMKDPANRRGTYWIVSKLSEGGMGEVFRGWDGRLGRWVALKFLKRPESEEARAMFQREAGLAAGLDHPNIAKVWEVGDVDGKPFLAMQYIDGTTLDAAARGAGRERAMEWVRQAAAGVRAAHAAGVIHRDLKPSNVMIDAEGHAFVLDFGLARAIDVGDTIPGGSRIVAGTPHYMSPEQARGRSDARSDVYGLGAILYEVVTGRPPFVGETAAEVLLQVVDREPVAPRKLDPGSSRDCEAIILKCLEKDPARRYGSVSPLLEDLDACLKHEPLRHARRRTVFYVLGKSLRRQPVPWTLGAIACALLAIGGALALAWFVSPGTVRLAVTPAGATVRIDGRTWTAGTGPLALELPAGIREILVEAPGHEPLRLPILVRRRYAQDIRMDLRHDKGSLEAIAEPGDAAIEVDGRDFGARIAGLELDTGLHELTASAPGCFDVRRAVEIRRGVQAHVDFSLDRAELWRVRSEAIQSGCKVVPLPDLNGDGTEDFAAEELTAAVIFSGATGAVLRRESVSDTPQWNLDLVDLGRARVLASRSDSKKGLRISWIDFAPGWEGRPSVAWTEPGASLPDARPATIQPAADRDGDGVREVVAGGRGGMLRVLDGASGRLVSSISLGDPGLQVTALRVDGDVAMFAGPTHGRESPAGPHLLGAVSLKDGSTHWSRRSSWDAVAAVDLAGPGRVCLLAVSGSSWEITEGLTGERRLSLALPFPDLLPSPVDLDGDGACELLLGLSADHTVAFDATSGRFLWESAQRRVFGHVVGPDGTILFLTPDGVRSVGGADGKTRWTLPGTSDHVVSGDIDRDGVREIFVGSGRDGICCLSADGTPRWTLRLRGSPSPLALLGTSAESHLIFARGSSFVGVARAPRVLWHAEAAGPLLAAPVVARLTGGRHIVVQHGDWGARASLRAFDGKTGDVVWSLQTSSPPNFPAAIADLDGDGDEEVIAWTQTDSGDVLGPQIFRARDGAPGRMFFAPPRSDAYSVPVVADFDGDGAPDLAGNRRLAADAVAFSGKSGALLWRRPLGGESWGGAACADLDGDHLPDLVVPADGQPLRALHGRDGTVIWECAIGSGARTAPVLITLNADPVPDVLAVSSEGEIFAIDGQGGAILSSLKCAATAVTSSPDGGPRFLVARGQEGLTLYAWPGFTPLWSRPGPVEAPAAIGDIDADGRFEAVIATLAGAVEILDLATGGLLWSEAVSDEGCVARPTLFDLDRDGILDILVADKSGRLSVLSGNPTRVARR